MGSTFLRDILSANGVSVSDGQLLFLLLELHIREVW